MMASFMRLIAFVALAVQLFTTTTAFTSISNMHNTAYRPNYLSTTPIMQNNNNVIAATTSNSQLYMATATPTAPVPVKKREKKVSSDNATDDEKAKDRGWLVRLYNDPMNKREFVARALMEVCGLDDGMAFSVMMKAHQLGISVIGNYHLEQAEMYKIRLLEEGLLVDMIPADDEE